MVYCSHEVNFQIIQTNCYTSLKQLFASYAFKKDFKSFIQLIELVL